MLESCWALFPTRSVLSVRVFAHPIVLEIFEVCQSDNSKDLVCLLPKTFLVFLRATRVEDDYEFSFREAEDKFKLMYTDDKFVFDVETLRCCLAFL